ncbi:MAG: hypothetical protein ACRDKI_06565 [Solirubrobacterales bacterium]
MIATRKVVLSALLCVVALATSAGAAQATTVPASAAHQFFSPQASGAALYWFERGGFEYNPRRSTSPPGVAFGVPTTAEFITDSWLPGAIYSRPQPGGKVSKVFKAPRNQRINGFKARAGRIVIGLEATNDFDDHPIPTEIAELKPNSAGGWDKITLMAKTDVPTGGDCGSWVKLFNVDADGNVVVNVGQIEGLNGKCELMRLRSTLVEIAPSGAQRSLLERVSGWGDEDDSFVLPAVRSGAGDWYLSAEPGLYDTGDVSMKNIETGKSFLFPQINREFFSADVSATGAALITNPRSTIDHTLLFPDPTQLNRAVHLGRRGSITWFHLCENKIVEFSRKRAGRRHRGGRRWNVFVRDAEGNNAVALDVHLPRGTQFETCTKDVAFLHQRLRKGRARQFSIGLTPVAGPSGATGPTH